MQTNEVEPLSDGAVITYPATDEQTSPVTAGNYEAVRLNAMKHGILSRLVVLAHEDHAEFADLLAALIEEHRPAGMTERHLVEELGTIIWRKRRVLLAEGAKINEGRIRPAADTFHDMTEAVTLREKPIAECGDETSGARNKPGAVAGRD